MSGGVADEHKEDTFLYNISPIIAGVYTGLYKNDLSVANHNDLMVALDAQGHVNK